jgi:hypothetical protein
VVRISWRWWVICWISHFNVRLTFYFLTYKKYLRASVVVLKENDPAPVINSVCSPPFPSPLGSLFYERKSLTHSSFHCSQEVGVDVFEPMVVLHPGVALEQYYFNVKIFRGQDISRPSKSYRPNPRVVVTLGGVT